MTSGVSSRTRALAVSTPSSSPAMDTWLLFSLGLERFESGKWMWQLVSAITRRIVFPPFVQEKISANIVAIDKLQDDLVTSESVKSSR